MFATVVLVSYFAAPYSNLFFLLLAFLTSLGLLALVWTRAHLRGVAAEVSAVAPTAAGIGAEVRATLTRARHPLFAVATTCNVVLASGRSRRCVATFHPRARSGDILYGRLEAFDRGVYALERGRLESAWPLGLLRASIDIPLPARLIVHPKPASIPEARDRAALLLELGGTQSAAAGDFGPSGLRELRDGDDPREIDWKATARRSTFIVREREQDCGQGIEVCIDRRCEADALEAALSLATALAFLARDNKEAFSLCSQDIHATFGAGQRPMDELLAWLAACTTLPDGAPAPPPTSPDVLHLPAGTNA